MITAAAFVLMVVTVYRRYLLGWIAAPVRSRSRRRRRKQAAAAVDVTQGNIVCGVRVDAYEAVTIMQITGRPYTPTFLRDVTLQRGPGRVVAVESVQHELPGRQVPTKAARLLRR